MIEESRSIGEDEVVDVGELEGGEMILIVPLNEESNPQQDSRSEDEWSILQQV